MPISQGDMNLKEQLETADRLLRQGYTQEGCAEEMGCSTTHVNRLNHYNRAVDNEQIHCKLDQLIHLHYAKRSGYRPRGKYFSFYAVFKLLRLEVDRNPEMWDEVEATNYGPGAQEFALEKALGKPLEDASDDDLLRVRYSDFKWHLEHP